MRNRIAAFSIAVAITALLPASASAATIDWTNWTTVNSGSPTGGSASGTAGGITVNYSGEVLPYPGYNPIWTPTSTWADGTIIANAPPSTTQGFIPLQGGAGTGTDTITFSAPVTNPVMAIWSLGQTGTLASLQFNDPFTIVAGGPSSQFGGSAITVCSSGVCGLEGNGSIEFLGTFSSISFTTPDPEYWYAFNVGVNAQGPVPGAGLTGLAFLALAGTAARARGLFAR